MGWTKVCGTAQSGIWVLKGDARAASYLIILNNFGWNGGLEELRRTPGSRQGTTVCVHICVDMEQQSDHKLRTPSGMEYLACGAGSHSSCRFGVQEGLCQRE